MFVLRNKKKANDFFSLNGMNKLTQFDLWDVSSKVWTYVTRNTNRNSLESTYFERFSKCDCNIVELS